MQSEFEARGVMVLGVVRESAAQAQQFQVEYALNYPVLADAHAMFDAFGVDAVWGSVVYLVDADEKIVARGIENVRTRLESLSASG